jgi:hypothetical protein
MRTFPDVCGVVVDKRSVGGLVVVTGGGFPVQQVKTGEEGTGNPYQELIVRDGQTCEIRGGSTVIYCKPRVRRPPPEIIIRLQADGTGKFSTPHNRSVMNPNITATEFFAWFANWTGRGGSDGPPSLRFTFKDAVPPKSSVIARTNDDHFNLMRGDIRVQFEKAKVYMPNLTEFAVLVTDPRWVSVDVEDRDW